MKTSTGGIRGFARAATRILLVAGALAAGGAAAQGTAKATFAGGCFWCMEAPRDERLQQLWGKPGD